MVSYCRNFLAHGVCRRAFKLNVYSLPTPNTLMIENSVIDAQKAAQMIMESWSKSNKVAHDRGESIDIKMPPLINKNIFRKARAMHFGNAEDSEIHYALHLLEKDQECGEYASMAAKMRGQLNYYLSMPSANKAFEPWLLRASFQNPYFEYYNFGKSALFFSHFVKTITPEYNNVNTKKSRTHKNSLSRFTPHSLLLFQAMMNQNLYYKGMKAAMPNLSFLMTWMMMNFHLFLFSSVVLVMEGMYLQH